MKRPADHDPLLDDVLAEAAPPEFRDQLLQTTLRQARRRRRFRRGRQAVLGVAVVCLLGVLLSRRSVGPLAPPAVVAQPPEFPLVIVRTELMPASAVVTSVPLPQTAVVSTSSGLYRIIGDDELLALAAPAPVGLIRCGPDCAELVFANAADRERLLVP